MRKKYLKTGGLRAVRSLKRKAIIGKIGRAVLATVGTAGLLATAVVAPNAVQAIFGNKGNKQKRWYMKKVLVELEDKGLVRQEKTGGRVK